jgi:cell division septal protein FtsQ
MKKSDKKISKKPKNKAPSKPMSEEQNTLLKIVMLFLILGTLLCTLVFGSIYIYRAVCTENSNYILRNVSVISNGYWNSKNKVISNFLKLKIGKDNIFKLDLKKINAKSLDLPGVKNCETKRILPDTVQINLIERVPRAKISRHNAYLVDEDGIILMKKYCMTSAQSLPLITGFPPYKKFTVNKSVPELFNTMRIITLTLQYYSDIEIVAVDVRDKDFLKFYVRYNRGRMRQAIMPNSLNGIDIRLKALRTALIRSHAENDKVNIYNLSFDGRVVCQ